MFWERTGKSLVKQAKKKEWIDFKGQENYLISYNKLEVNMMLFKLECSYDQEKKNHMKQVMYMISIILNQNNELLKI